MNEDKILAALTQLQGNVEQMRDDMNARLDKVDARLDKVEQELTAVKADVAAVKADVGGVKIVMETEVTRNICLIAEGQTGLFDKVAPLPEAVDGLQRDMRVVKSVLMDHSVSIRELSLA